MSVLPLTPPSSDSDSLHRKEAAFQKQPHVRERINYETDDVREQLGESLVIELASGKENETDEWQKFDREGRALISYMKDIRGKPGSREIAKKAVEQFMKNPQRRAFLIEKIEETDNTFKHDVVLDNTDGWSILLSVSPSRRQGFIAFKDLSDDDLNVSPEQREETALRELKRLRRLFSAKKKDPKFTYEDAMIEVQAFRHTYHEFIHDDSSREMTVYASAAGKWRVLITNRDSVPLNIDISQ